MLGLVFKIENSQSHGHVQELLAAKLRTYFGFDCVSVVSPLLISSGFGRLVFGFFLLGFIWALKVSFGNNKNSY